MSAELKKELDQLLNDKPILIVEPSANFRDSLKRFLVNLGVKNVKFVSSAADAKREMITKNFGFFIVEWVLEGQNGLEFCRRIRTKKGYEYTPFLLVTAENLKSDVILASEAGVDGYLLKPFAYNDFCTQLFEIVRACKNPSKLNSIIRMAEIYMIKKDFEKSLQNFNGALKEKPDSARALCGVGQISFIKKNHDRAIEYFEKAIVSNPDYIDAYNKLLSVYEESDNSEKQLSIAKKAHKLSPDNPRYTLILAKGFFDSGEMQESENFFKKTLLNSPKLADAYKGLGHVFMEKEEHSKAIKNFKKALDLKPADMSILNSLGMAHVKKGLVVQGIDQYKLALKIDALNWRVLFNLGYAYEKMGDEVQAKTYLERSLASNPDNEKCVRRLKKLKQQAS